MREEQAKKTRTETLKQHQHRGGFRAGVMSQWFRALILAEGLGFHL